MKIRAITFTPNGKRPDTVSVTMSLAEAAAISSVFGAMNGYAARKLGLDHLGSVWDCLDAQVFNPYFENGVSDVLPGSVDLATLNDAPS